MALKVYLPAMRHPVVNGLRLGLGVALIGTLLAETKISRGGIGFMVIQAYANFNMSQMYAIIWCCSCWRSASMRWSRGLAASATSNGSRRGTLRGRWGLSVPPNLPALGEEVIE